MVGDKYTQLAPLARLSPLCPYSGPAVLREVGEVVYSQAENKTNISTGLSHMSPLFPLSLLTCCSGAPTGFSDGYPEADEQSNTNTYKVHIKL